jgi:hypothetical protein
MWLVLVPVESDRFLRGFLGIEISFEARNTGTAAGIEWWQGLPRLSPPALLVLWIARRSNLETGEMC